MAKYDKYKKLYFSNNIIKGQRTTTGNAFGKFTNSGVGNEAVEMVEWINERIELGDIITDTTPFVGTNLGGFIDGFGQYVLTSSTGTDITLTQATFSNDGVLSREDWVSFDAVITLAGVPRQDVNLGTFTGTIIPDNRTIKQALQDLETAVSSITGATTGNLTTSSTGLSITNGTNAVFGAGTQIVFTPGLVNLTTLGGNLNLSQLQTSGVIGNQILKFNGSVWENWTPNYTTIASGGIGDMLYYNGTAYVPITPRRNVQIVNSGNVVTIPHTPITNTIIDVFVNGVYQDDGVDYVQSGNTFTFTVSFNANNKVTIKYYT